MSDSKDFIMHFESEDGRPVIGLFSSIGHRVCKDITKMALSLPTYDSSTKDPVGWADDYIARINTYILEDRYLNLYMDTVKDLDSKVSFKGGVGRALKHLQKTIIKLTDEVKKSHAYVGLTSHVGLHEISTDILRIDANFLLLLIREFVDLYTVNYCRGYERDDLERYHHIFKERRSVSRIRLFGRVALWVFKRRR